MFLDTAKIDRKDSWNENENTQPTTPLSNMPNTGFKLRTFPSRSGQLTSTPPVFQCPVASNYAFFVPKPAAKPPVEAPKPVSRISKEFKFEKYKINRNHWTTHQEHKI